MLLHKQKPTFIDSYYVCLQAGSHRRLKNLVIRRSGELTTVQVVTTSPSSALLQGGGMRGPPGDPASISSLCALLCGCYFSLLLGSPVLVYFVFFMPEDVKCVWRTCFSSSYSSFSRMVSPLHFCSYFYGCYFTLLCRWGEYQEIGEILPGARPFIFSLLILLGTDCARVVDPRGGGWFC